ncbi:unnamed protein product [Schistocephalus solidus]|uniref:Uncharacterized protein n=1 Tax=Schistocephalus solidus TaxID=70667 RepID=A0A183SQA9_SCHSO|nr:unnamed protein product [Schistocephalus solidus]
MCGVCRVADQWTGCQTVMVPPYPLIERILVCALWGGQLVLWRAKTGTPTRQPTCPLPLPPHDPQRLQIFPAQTAPPNFNSYIGLVGHLRIHRMGAGKPVATPAFTALTAPKPVYTAEAY